MIDVKQNGHLNGDPRAWAREYIKHGLVVIPIPPKSKRPLEEDWPHLRIGEADVPRYFTWNSNIGGLCGCDSGNLADVDFDWHIDPRIVQTYLPPTRCTFGHRSKPRSHHLFRIKEVSDAYKPHKLIDPLLLKEHGENATILELRWSAGGKQHQQTVLPGSVHISGEPITFDSGAWEEPATVEWDTLEQAVYHIGAAALVARHWPGQGVRHDAALAFGGMFVRAGWDEDDAAEFVELVAAAAGDEQVDDRVKAVHDTYTNYQSGEQTTGQPTLEQFIDDNVVKQVRRWLHLKASAKAVQMQADLDNARRLAEMYGEELRYCDGSWYYWDGKRWKKDEGAAITRRYAHDVVDALRIERHRDKDSIKAGDAHRINGMLQEASRLDGIFLAAGSFDQRADLYNCQNGTLELDVHSGSVELREHRREDLLTKISSVNYVPGATHPALDAYFDYFIVQKDGVTKNGDAEDAEEIPIWKVDMERRDFLQELAGHTLTGLPKREAALIQGPTNSGKSMLLAMLRNCDGDYAKPLEFTSLARERNPHPGGHRDDIAGLVGSRIVTISEIPENFEPDVALFKLMLSGGDKGQYRMAYGHMREICFTHTLWIATNPEFELPPADEAAYERTYKIVFPRTRPEAERDSVAALELVSGPAVLEAFLAWRVAGFQRLYRRVPRRLQVPESVRTATKEMRLAVDPFASFFEECCEFTGDASDYVRCSHLWQGVKEFFEVHRLRRLKASGRDGFEASVKRHGAWKLQSKAVDGNNEVWRGLTFKQRVFSVEFRRD
jgi:phage/plasmid-associated DNA primase